MGLSCCKLCWDNDEPPIDDRSAGQRASTTSRYSQNRTFSTSSQAPIVRPPSLRTRNVDGFPNAAVQARATSVQPRVVQPHNHQQPILGILENETSRLRCRKVTRDDNIVLMMMRELRPHHALSVPPEAGYVLERLDPNSDEFLRKTLFRHEKFNENYQIEEARRVWNPFLKTQYMLKKTKYEDKCKEIHLFHGTGKSRVPAILTHNFDWRLTRECWYGKGVYFAKNPFYAALYSKKRQSGSTNYVMIVAKVLVEEGAIIAGNVKTAVPDQGHTTISEHGHEIIKYEDACFYPEFLVYFRPTQPKMLQ